ncbi:MAG: hypothetical protein RL028_472, partial [Actinomycetota bacterium]
RNGLWSVCGVVDNADRPFGESVLQHLVFGCVRDCHHCISAVQDQALWCEAQVIQPPDGSNQRVEFFWRGSVAVINQIVKRKNQFEFSAQTRGGLHRAKKNIDSGFVESSCGEYLQYRGWVTCPNDLYALGEFCFHPGVTNYNCEWGQLREFCN